MQDHTVQDRAGNASILGPQVREALRGMRDEAAPAPRPAAQPAARPAAPAPAHSGASGGRETASAAREDGVPLFGERAKVPPRSA